MLKLIIALLISALMCYELNKLIGCYLRKSNGLKERFFYIAVVFAMFSITFFYKMNDVVVIVCYGIGVALMELHIEAGMKEKLLCFVYSFCILAGQQLLAVVMLSNDSYIIGDQLILRQLIISMMQLFVVNILWRKRRGTTEIKTPMVYWLMFLLVPVFSLHFISLLLQSQSISSVNVILGVIGILVIDFVIDAMYQALSDSYELLLKQKMEEEQSRYYKKQLEYITESYQTVRSVKHDIKNILNSIKNMIREEKYEDILGYIDGVNDSTGFNTTYVETGNSAMDGILNYQIQRARNLDINMECRASIPQQINVDEIDMSKLLGNILDNAIEATSQIQQKDERIIEIHIHLKKDNLFIHVTNPYVGTIQRDHNGNMMTSKKDKLEHGIGLRNVNQVIEKYHGEMYAEEKDQIFSTEIILYL